MIDIFELFTDFEASANTDQGGFWRPETDFQRNVNLVSRELWNELIDEAEKTQKNNDFLAPFMNTVNLPVVNAGQFYGTVTYPADYGRFGAARILVIDGQCYEYDCDRIRRTGWKPENEFFAFYNPDLQLEIEEQGTDDLYDRVAEYPIDEIDRQRWGACLAHLTKGPTLGAPKMVQTGKGFKVAPRLVSVVVLDYYTRPVDAKFVYTNQPGDPQTGSGDQLIYNQQQSVPLQWSDMLKDEFIKRLLPRYGIFTSNPLLFQQSKANP